MKGIIGSSQHQKSPLKIWNKCDERQLILLTNHGVVGGHTTDANYSSLFKFAAIADYDRDLRIELISPGPTEDTQGAESVPAAWLAD
jgi:hypothetical protein